MIIWFSNVNYRYGENAFLPYTAARLWAYAYPRAPGWELGEMLWDREPIEEVIERMRAKPPSALALCTYVWNEQWNLALGRAVRAHFPDCRIIAGGPQVPVRNDYLFEHPCLTSVAHGEGEDSLVAFLTDKHPLRIYTASRMENLATVPSPYLSGVLGPIVRSRPDVKWQALQETNRGCPYSCTFCDWGSATYSKVRKFEIGTCIAELEWFAANKIELLYNCDANFGMFEQDEEFTDALIECSKQTGYPKKFRAAYAKKITPRVFNIAKKISDAGLSKGATISFQSMDADVLKKVKRLNPVQSSLAETFDRYHSNGISTYTELIVGLPGETVESFKRGVDELLDAGQHYGLNIYPCMALRNSELTHQGVETREVQLLLLHGSAGRVDPHPEKYDLVTSTATMTHAEWKQAWIFGIVVQALHCGGVTDLLAIRKRAEGVKYSEFYDSLINNPSPTLRSAIRETETIIDRALSGDPWSTIEQDIQWPLEEFLRLRVTRNYHAFITGLKAGSAKDISSSSLPDGEDDFARWAREVVWYGRKGGAQKKELAHHG